MSGKTKKTGLAKRSLNSSLNRRTVLKGAAATVAAAAVGTGETWLVQLRNAAKAGVAPADISMLGGFARLRGAAEELWLPLDESQIPNATKYLDESFVYRYPDGRLYGVGAVSWFITLCSNTDVYPEAPTSWADMWDPKYEDSLGLLALASNSYLLDITANTFFDADALTTQEGIEKVLAKLAEVKPNVRLWYKDEGTFQQALQDGEVPMGQYYHDVTELARADGFPVRSTFPKEAPTKSSPPYPATSRRSSRNITSTWKWATGSATAGPR
jgi:putative spermidine/putrescine transport system substrate-binding protein